MARTSITSPKSWIVSPPSKSSSAGGAVIGCGQNWGPGERLRVGSANQCASFAGAQMRAPVFSLRAPTPPM